MDGGVLEMVDFVDRRVPHHFGGQILVGTLRQLAEELDHPAVGFVREGASNGRSRIRPCRRAVARVRDRPHDAEVVADDYPQGHVTRYRLPALRAEFAVIRRLIHVPVNPFKSNGPELLDFDP
jgi:hypothetical protein